MIYLLVQNFGFDFYITDTLGYIVTSLAYTSFKISPFVHKYILPYRNIIYFSLKKIYFY